MGPALVFALVVNPGLAVLNPVGPNDEWEEAAYLQKIPGYHPYLRFNPQNTFVFKTPYYIAEGHYQRQGGHYTFRPETAVQLNHADVDKLVAGLPAEAAAEQQDHYAKSVAVFEADYNDDEEMLSLNYTLDGRPRSFQLFPYGQGDDKLTSLLTPDEAQLKGLWHAPEPFPERLDSKTRYRIEGIDGLSRFSTEAMASDGAQFQIMDLRVDKTCRIHADTGRWDRDGSTLVLLIDNTRVEFQISNTNQGMKLLSGGKVAYIRN